jgi:DNA-binding MarR family transcriptional regulator
VTGAWRAAGCPIKVSSVNDASSRPGPPLAAADAAKVEAAELLTALGAIRRMARRMVRNSPTAGALAPARSEVLRLAARRPGISVAEAARDLCLAPNSVSTMVSQLAADGLISRGRADSDGRSVRLTVTRAGTARIAQWKDIRADAAARALAQLAASDRQAIRSAIPALGRLAEQMEQL